jgi:hypothetical protein
MPVPRGIGHSFTYERIRANDNYLGGVDYCHRRSEAGACADQQYSDVAYWGPTGDVIFGHYPIP